MRAQRDHLDRSVNALPLPYPKLMLVLRNSRSGKQ